MTVSARVNLIRTALAVAAVASLAGCAVRYDSRGNQIYMWQFNQGSHNAVDYSNPRLPVLPRTRPLEELWEIPSPYEFNDLSRYSMVAPDAPLTGATTSVGHNAGCAAPCQKFAPAALLVSRADARNVVQSRSER
jgi:hypothetical protein